MNHLEESLISLRTLLAEMSDEALMNIYNEVHAMPIEGITVEEYFGKVPYVQLPSTIIEPYGERTQSPYNISIKNKAPNFSGLYFLCNIAA